MKHKYNNIEYHRVMPFDLQERRNIRELALDKGAGAEPRTYFMVVVQNEDVMDYWLMEQVSDLPEVQRFYQNEEPWASWQEPLVFSFMPYAV